MTNTKEIYNPENLNSHFLNLKKKNAEQASIDLLKFIKDFIEDSQTTTAIENSTFLLNQFMGFNETAGFSDECVHDAVFDTNTLIVFMVKLKDLWTRFEYLRPYMNN